MGCSNLVVAALPPAVSVVDVFFTVPPALPAVSEITVGEEIFIYARLRNDGGAAFVDVRWTIDGPESGSIDMEPGMPIPATPYEDVYLIGWHTPQFITDGNPYVYCVDIINQVAQ